MKAKMLLTGLCAVLTVNVCAAKPNIWIHTDMTAVLKENGVYKYVVKSGESEAATDPVSNPSDADDQVAMAIYLMQANKFNTVRIVLGITPRDTKVNVATFFDDTFRKAYAADFDGMNKAFKGYPTAKSLAVSESSCTAGKGTIIKFKASTSYKDIKTLPATVKLLVDALNSKTYSATNPLYVCVWGPLTEAAMATKHLIENKNTTALNRLFVVSHWTSSYLLQAPAGKPFEVANCKSDGDACAYMHSEAKKSGAAFKFVDLGSIGQGGIVSGYDKNWFGGLTGSKSKEFNKSELGKLFIKSKFVNGKPDGSDCATFYAILDTYGVKLSKLSTNGTLTKAQETAGRDAFAGKAQSMLDELLKISNAAAAK